MAPTTATTTTAWIATPLRATRARPRIAARQNTRLVIATCSRWVN